MINFTLKYILPLLLITVLCVVGVKAFYRLAEKRIASVETEPKVSSGEPAVAAKSAVIKDKQIHADASVITRRNLFASKEDAAVKEEAVDPFAVAQPTKLAFVLMGTAIDAENDNRAFIYDKKKRRQEMYREGDDLQGALIRQISYGKVVITVNGKNELLDIAEARKVNVPKVKRPAPVTTARKVTGRPVSGTDRTVQQPSPAAVVNPNAARARQIRAYRSRTAPVSPTTGPTTDVPTTDEPTPEPTAADKADSQATDGAGDTTTN
mgnify:CR=1 FL=1